MPKKNDKKTLLLVDGNALIHRGFHAIPYLSTKHGEVTNGVYGFALLFLNALRDIKPEYVAVSFDLPKPTFRDKLYEEYKGKRVAAPDELYEQIPRVKELVSVFNVPIYEKAGFEADDVIGTLAKQADEMNLKAVILTGDFDTLQLVNGNIKVYAPKKGLSETQLYGDKEVREKYGLTPEQLVDYKALRGDPSDNIPGVKGIGEKGATDLLTEFGELDSIYEYLKEHPDGKKIKPRIAKLLVEYKDDAYLSQKLAQIVCDVPVRFDLGRSLLSDFDEQKVVSLFQELEFKSLLPRIPRSETSRFSVPLSGSDDNLGEGPDCVLIDTEEKFIKFINSLGKQEEIVIDIESTSRHPMEAELVGVGVAWKKGKAYYVPSAFVLEDSKQSQQFINILENSAIKKIGHNIKYDYLVLKKSGISLQGISFDTMIASYLLNPGGRSLSLDDLAFSEFGYRMQKIEELIGKGKQQVSMADVEVKKVCAYCCEDVDYTLQLKDRLNGVLRENKRIWRIFQEIEIPLIQTLADMEFYGIKIDPAVLSRFSREASGELKRIEKEIYTLAGNEFNIGSPIQLKEVLFEKLHIPTEGIKKGKTGYSTASTELEKLRGLHPIIDFISEWRELSKLKNTYLDTLPKLINKKTSRVHTSFNQTITATGRLSSSDPNLQNIPVRTDFGKKVRGAFIAAPGYDLVSVDYSQIELRLAAHLSGDEKMLKVFQEGGDIHEATAQEIGVDRRKAKVINFGILYGLSAYGLTTRIPEVSRGEAEDFIEKYKQAYPELIKYLDGVIERTRDEGFVENEIGRIRNLPDINSSQFQVRSAAERAAINMPLQSLAADIIKMAMIKLAKEGLTTNKDCRLLLQVHDELVFEIEERKMEVFIDQIKQNMENIYRLKIPLIVEVKVGNNWEAMTKI